MTGWREGLGPWTPVIEGDRLYGRGGADDGYAAFARSLAIEAAQARRAPARALRRADRGQRGERQPRPAGVPRRARPIGSARRAGGVPRLGLRSTTSGCGSPRRCAGCVGGDADASRCSTRACTPATPAAWCRRASASCASCSTASRTATTGEVLLAELHVEIPTDRLARGRATRRPSWPDPLAERLPVRRRRPGRWPTTRSSSCSPARGARRSASPAPTASRRPAGPATCCARRRRCTLSVPPAADVRPDAAAPRARPRRSTPTRRTARHVTLRRQRPRHRAGTRPRSRRGCGRRSTTRRAPRSASRRGRSARAARSRSWACSARCSPTRSS